MKKSLYLGASIRVNGGYGWSAVSFDQPGGPTVS